MQRKTFQKKLVSMIGTLIVTELMCAVVCFSMAPFFSKFMFIQILSIIFSFIITCMLFGYKSWQDAEHEKKLLRNRIVEDKQPKFYYLRIGLIIYLIACLPIAVQYIFNSINVDGLLILLPGLLGGITWALKLFMSKYQLTAGSPVLEYVIQLVFLLVIPLSMEISSRLSDKDVDLSKIIYK